MNAEEYQKAQKDLEELDRANWDDPDVADNAEYIEHRKNCLRADIFAYQHPDGDHNPYETRCNSA